MRFSGKYWSVVLLGDFNEPEVEIEIFARNTDTANLRNNQERIQDFIKGVPASEAEVADVGGVRWVEQAIRGPGP